MDEEEKVRWRTVEMDNAFHVIPAHDIMPHTLLANCYCQPILDGRDMESGMEVFLHNYVFGIVN